MKNILLITDLPSNLPTFKFMKTLADKIVHRQQAGKKLWSLSQIYEAFIKTEKAI